MKKNAPNWDKINCTYSWIIDLDKSHSENYSQTLNKLFGYSKAIDNDEPKDKFQLLMTKILMFYNKGYLFKSLCIHVYIKQGIFMNTKSTVEILKLYKDKYEINPICISDIEFHNRFFIAGGIKSFLNKFYEDLKNNKSVNELKPRAKKFDSDEKYLNVDTVELTSKEQMNEYCKKLINKGYSIESVAEFMLKYHEKYFKN